jgi:predicted nucleotidyltransferase
MHSDDYFTRITQELKSNRFTQFCQEHQVKLAILFGSQATGRAGKESDIDLAIMLEKEAFPKPGGTSLEAGRKKRKLVRDLSAFFQTSKIDLVLLNLASPLLRLQVAKTGKLIYQRSRGDFADLASLALRQHSDAKLFYQLGQKYLQQANS